MVRPIVLTILATALCGPLFAGQPNMSMSSPTGGESYVIGQPETVVYSGKTRFKTLTVELSRDWGNTWSPLGIINNVVKATQINKRNKLAWTVEGPPSPSCLIRISGTLGPKAHPKTYSVTSGMFSIASADGFGGGAVAPGPQGPAGTQGPAGPKGDKGDKGDAGAKGDTGANGEDGSMGPAGPKGEAGLAGPAGPQGEVGPQGVAGLKGDTGVAGPKGDTGVTGTAGPQGDVGPQGIQGPQGDKGDTGPTGLKGDTGVAGPAGPQGDAGPKGDTGATGPRGETGTTGAQGPKGDTGAAGPKGDTGAAGPKGEIGVAGPKGDTGATGAQGPKGDTGAAGPKGDTGAAGPQGVAGPKGNTGATGPQGPVGPQGPAGFFNGAGGQVSITIPGGGNQCDDNGSTLTQTITNPAVKTTSIIVLTFVDSTLTHTTLSLRVGTVSNGSFTVLISDRGVKFNSSDKINYILLNP